MRIKLFSAIALLFFLCAAASAQNYTIRVKHNTNLRASTSLDSAVLASAPAGSSLLVIDRQSGWLRVVRSGLQFWMADWVGYTREDQSAPAPAQPAANIDNCCYVDRQCHSEQDWTNGWWAFRNGQCVAPAQPRLATPAPPSGRVSPFIDNCCQSGWQCQTDADWRRGWLAYQANRCEVGVSSGGVSSGGGASASPIGVSGSPAFAALVNRALNLLQARASHWYIYAVSRLRRVVEVHPPAFSHVSLPDRVAYYSVPNPYRPRPDDDLTMALFLVHEACHLHQYDRGSTALEWQEERECVLKELDAIQFLNPNSRMVSWLHQILANIQDPRSWWWR